MGVAVLRDYWEDLHAWVDAIAFYIVLSAIAGTLKEEPWPKSTLT